MNATHDGLQRLAEHDDPQGRERAPRRGGRGLALLVALLIAGVLAVGSLADGLATTPQSATTSAQTHQVGLSTVSLSVDPSPLHAYQAESLLLRVSDVSGAAVVGASAECALSMPAMGMSLPMIAGKPTAQPGEYVCQVASLEAGAWTLALTLRLPTGETGHTTFQLTAA